MKTKRNLLIGALPLLTMTTSALAAETVTYTYDALGRLVTSTVSGGPTDGTNTAIQYDPAGNRSNYAVTGSVNNSPPSSGRVIVIPLNGYTLIPLP